MTEVNKMMSQWVISLLVSLTVFMNLISAMAFLENQIDIRIGFYSKTILILTFIVILILNYRVYVHGDEYKRINTFFTESKVNKVITAILTLAYYFLSVRLFFYSLENSPWRGEL